jgi:3-methyladenine DNA glycosylase Tag
MDYELVQRYDFAKIIVLDHGFHHEINWQAKVSFEDLDEKTFLRELSWVVLSSGMKTAIIEKKFGPISKCFYQWKSAALIVKNGTQCFESALQIFNNKAKMNAIIDAATKISRQSFAKIKELIATNPIEFLQKFKFIGPTTVYHLAKNIGLDFAKPDRHLKRIASMHGYSDVQKFCREISKNTDDAVPVIDIVFWRFATIEPDYLNVLSSLNFNQNIS